MVDPDHPLAMLVRKAQADSPAPTPPAADGAAVQPAQAEYTADCEYLALPLRPPPLQGFPSGVSREEWGQRRMRRSGPPGLSVQRP